MIQRKTGEPNIQFFPKTASTSYLNGSVVYPDGLGGITTASYNGYSPLGIIQLSVSSTSSDYALTTKVPIDVYSPKTDTFTFDVTGATPTASMIGQSYNLNLAKTAVDLSSAVTNGLVRITSLSGTGGVTTQYSIIGVFNEVPEGGSSINYVKGVIPDGQVAYDGSITTASPSTLTTATAFFTDDMIGKRALAVSFLDSSTYSIGGTILTVAANGLSATFSGTIAQTVATVCIVVGTDNSAALTAAGNAAALTGANIYLPPGVMVLTSKWVIPDGIGSIIGCPPSVPQPIAVPSQGSCLVYTGLVGAANEGFIELGTQTSSTAPKRTLTVIDSVAIDACNRYETALILKTRRSQLRNSVVQRGSITAVKVSGGACRLINNTCGQQNTGNVVNVGGPDTKIFKNELRQAGGGATSSAVVYIPGASNCQIVGNHFWNGGSGVLTAASPNTLAQNIRMDTSSDAQNLTIVGNTFDGVYGHHIKLRVTGGSAVLRGVTITGNNFFQTTGFPDATYAICNIEIGAGTSVRGLTFTGNTGRCFAGVNYRAMIEKEFSGTVTHDTVGNNTFLECTLPFYNVSGGTWIPTQHSNNVVAPGGSTAFSYGDNRGSLAQNGGGTVFNIPHSMGGTPTKFYVTPGSTDAAALFYVTADATNLIVTYKAATTGGVNNITHNWQAWL